MLDPERELDLTQRLVAAIAEEISRNCGGNDQLNWIEAESYLRHLLGDARGEAMSQRDVASPRTRSMHDTPTRTDRPTVKASAAARWVGEDRKTLDGVPAESNHA
jgi:hypothetical protein